MILSTIQTAKEKFWTDAINIRTALEKFQMDDASHLNSKQKILNGWCQLFKELTKNFKRMMPAIQTADKKFWMNDATHSNG